MNQGTPQKKITLFPGGFQYVKNYEGYGGVDIWTGQGFTEDLKNSAFFIGHSGGASFAFQYAANQTSKFILVNPLVKKRNIFSLFLRWMKYAFMEGLPKKKLVPVKYWPSAFKKVLELVKVDFLTAIKNIPKDNIAVIRGKKDNFFCDEEAVKIMRENNIKLIEVDAGHDWNENIAEAVREIIKGVLG